MRRLTVSFCGGVDVQSEVYDAVTNVIAIFEDSEQLYEQNFDIPEESQQCIAIELAVDEEDYDALRDRLVVAIRSRHPCEVIVGEYEDRDSAVIHGECQLLEHEE